MTVALASQVIGFISFSITLLTLLGVYSDLIKTLRGAPSAIPISLGNLREEIQFEQLYLNRKLKCGDEYNVFPDSRSKKRQRNREFIRLIDQSLRHLWVEFCALESAFVMKGETPWVLQVGNTNAADLGNGNGNDFDEKFSTSRRRRSARRPAPQTTRKESFIKNRMGWVEAGLSSDRRTYYSTDFFHRFLWWWKQADIKHLSDQVQRIQIRRMERDIYEADELVKRLFRHSCRTFDWRSSGSDSGGTNSDGGGGSDSDDHRGGAKRRRPSMTNSRSQRRRRRGRGKDNLGKGEREIYEREIVRSSRNPNEATSPRSRTVVKKDESRRGSVVYEYEVINPGRIYVESSQPDRPRSRQQSRPRSYSRERD